MCHTKVADAAAPRTLPKVVTEPVDPRRGRTLGEDLLGAAASVARLAVDAMMYGSMPGDRWHDYDQYRQHEAGAKARESAMAAALTAQAQAGAFDPPLSPAEAPDDGYWQCPRTHAELEPVTVAGLHAHVSRATGGLMLERDSERHLLAHPELWPAWVDLARRLAAGATVAVDGRALVYLSCPTCGGPMVRKNFEKVSGVMVDACLKHGTWFDAGELEQALAFLRAGGRDRRRDFEAQERAHIDEQRSQMRRIDARVSAGARRLRGLSF